MGIFYNNFSVESGAIYAYAGQALPFPVLCGVNPDPTNFNSLLKIQWKRGSNGDPIPSLNIKTINNLTSLNITSVPSADTKYSCHVTWIDRTERSLQFNLNINGIELAPMNEF